jgi:hypothetical protein
MIEENVSSIPPLFPSAQICRGQGAMAQQRIATVHAMIDPA